MFAETLANVVGGLLGSFASFVMAGVCMYAIGLVVFGKIQALIAIAFAPFGIALFAVDKGNLFKAAISMILQGIGTSMVAGVVVTIGLTAFNETADAIGHIAAASGDVFGPKIMFAFLSIALSLFMFILVLNSNRWAQGIFGSVGFDMGKLHKKSPTAKGGGDKGGDNKGGGDKNTKAEAFGKKLGQAFAGNGQVKTPGVGSGVGGGAAPSIRKAAG